MKLRRIIGITLLVCLLATPFVIVGIQDGLWWALFPLGVIILLVILSYIAIWLIN